LVKTKDGCLENQQAIDKIWGNVQTFW
jgi:hypothetical protein